MEIIKQNESFILKETTEAFEMNGNVNHDVSGSLSLHFNVNNLNGERVGDCHYSKYVEAGDVNFGVNCSEENRDNLIAYADTVVDSVLEYFKNI